MLNKIISYSFYSLFFLVPLFWTSKNYELFEYNKMILTYGFTVIIVGAWILKIINRKSLIFNRTLLDIPLLLFLLSQILSTILSIESHTSIWGYYSRSNGGLLSIISYLLLYWAYVSNMTPSKVFTTLKVGLASGFIISLWAILEHFGVSPSCVILRQEFNASCWIQDVQTRVFATLGQPNWLASYLTMLIFPAFYFLLTSDTTKKHITYLLSLITFYLALTFTKSAGGFLGFLGGLGIFLLLLFTTNKLLKKSLPVPNLKWLYIVLGSFLLINLYFGSALTKIQLRSLIFKSSQKAAPAQQTPAPATTQLESGGAETGKIRLIVWQGALDIFKHYPILGSGVETFAYSYYQFRPASHNLNTEWDFLYNKAHNEYLNYLATTGIVGFGTYMLVIGAFIWWSIKKIYNVQFKMYKNKQNSTFYILHSTLLASYASNLVQNFFGFSVVIIAIFFYLFPALTFVATESLSILHLPSSKNYLLSSIIHLPNLIYHRPFYTKFTKGLVILTILYLLFSIFQLWYADTIFERGEKASEAGNPGRAYNLLTVASELNKGEPFYRSELAYAAASAATALQDSDATLSAELKDEAEYEMERVLKNSPKNVSFWRTAIRTYFELSTIDKKYNDKTLEALDKAISFAPTDPKLYYNKALVLDSLNKKDEAIKLLQKSLLLKPNYVEALEKIKEATASGTKT